MINSRAAANGRSTFISAGTSAGGDRDFAVWLPQSRAELDQDEEFFDVDIDGGSRRIRFHEYHEIYQIPGLYEHLFYELLKCVSPRVVRELLAAELDRAGVDAASLRVLDVGAGNGMMGDELADLGVGHLVGVDVIPEAAMATERDRPGVYDEYHVVDLTQLDDSQRAEFAVHRLNCLLLVAALGFGDIPTGAFAAAHNVLETPAWLAFNIKEDFLDREDDDTGFAGLIRRMLSEGIIERRSERRYQHRLSVAGDPLHYLAIVAIKRADVPQDWFTDLA